MKELKFYIIPLMIIINSNLYAQRRPKPMVITTRLQENFYKLFVHDYVNMVVFSGPEGVLLVDTGMDPVDIITSELKKISDSPVKYIINTHSNGDHILGNAELGKEAVIISSTICREDIKKRDDFPEDGLPDITFTESLYLRFNQEDIHLYFMSGHTGNDIIVFFKKANIVCLGDLIFSDSFPGVQPVRGGNAYVLGKTLKKIVESFPEDAVYVMGHGREYTMKDIKEYYSMTKQTIALVTPLIEKGMSLPEIIKQEPLQEWKEWESRFFPGEITCETWIENIFESYK